MKQSGKKSPTTPPSKKGTVTAKEAIEEQKREMDLLLNSESKKSSPDKKASPTETRPKNKREAKLLRKNESQSQSAVKETETSLDFKQLNEDDLERMTDPKNLTLLPTIRDKFEKLHGACDYF